MCGWVFGVFTLLPTYEPGAECALPLPQVLKYGTYVKIEFCGQFFAFTPYFLNDWIFPHMLASHKFFRSTNDGHVKPFPVAHRRYPANHLRICEVGAVPWTAATAIWAASRTARDGIASLPRIAFASSSASPVTSRTGNRSTISILFRASSGSPADTSSITICKTKQSKSSRRLVYQSCVICWCAATRRSRLGREER